MGTAETRQQYQPIHLIADKKIEARKSGPRTFVDVASLKTYYAGLPKITKPTPLYCSIAKPEARLTAKRKTRH